MDRSASAPGVCSQRLTHPCWRARWFLLQLLGWGRDTSRHPSIKDTCLETMKGLYLPAPFGKPDAESWESWDQATLLLSFCPWTNPHILPERLLSISSLYYGCLGLCVRCKTGTEKQRVLFWFSWLALWSWPETSLPFTSIFLLHFSYIFVLSASLDY